MKILKLLLTTAILITMVGLIVWKLQDNKKRLNAKADAAMQMETNIPVREEIVKKEIITGAFAQPGSFSPFKQMSLIADVQGKITAVNFENGSKVSAGTIMVNVDNELIQNQIDLATLNLQKMERDVARFSNLIGAGGVTQQQLDDAKLGVSTLKTQITGLNKQKSYTYIKSPIAGAVSGRMVEKGGFLAPGMKIADVVDIRKLKMDVFVTESQVFGIKKGEKYKILVDQYPDKTLTGTVTFIDVKADLSKRYLVQLELDNAAELLKAGMNGKVLFDKGVQRPSLVISRDCVVGGLKDAKVYLIEGNIVHLTPVVLGAGAGDKIEILSGLREGDHVVLTGQINLQDGMKVTIK